jgi:Mu-like prophage major head subunit gpT
MMIRGNFSDFFDTTMLPALNAKIWKTYNAKQQLYSKLLNVDTTGRMIEQFSQMAGVGLATLINEGQDTDVDTFVQGYHKTFKPAKYGLGIAASQELVEDDQIGIISKRAVALANSINQTIEIQGASVYNNAFDATNYAGPDGKALCASDHPLVKAGGTQSNLGTSADLDVTALEQGMTDWELTKTHEGFLQLLPTPRLLVAAANRWNVHEILKGQMRSDTANHTINAFQYTENGGTIEPIVWSFLTDPDAWFLVAPPAETETKWLWRKQAYTKSDYDERKEIGYVFMRYRADFGFYGFRGVWGNPGE